jgi:hypothetical protein
MSYVCVLHRVASQHLQLPHEIDILATIGWMNQPNWRMLVDSYKIVWMIYLACRYDKPTHAATAWDGRFSYWYWMNAWTNHDILACLEGRIRWTIDVSSSYGQPTRPEATAWDDILPRRNEWTNQIHASNSCSWSVAGNWSYLTVAVRIDLAVATKYLTSQLRHC